MEYGVKKQVRNFIVEKIKDENGVDYIKTDTVGGEWGIKYRFDHPMFVLLDSDDIDWVDSYMETLVNVSSIMDARFNGAFLSFMTLLEYRVSIVGGLVKPDRKTSKSIMDSIDFYAKLLISGERDDDAKIIEEMKLRDEIEEALKEEEKDS